MRDRADNGRETALVWVRDDLRLADNPALGEAASTGRPVTALYVLDEGGDRRPLGGAVRWWLHHSLERFGAALAAHGVTLMLRRGDPAMVVPEVATNVGAASVHWNRRWGGAERMLDARVEAALQASGVTVTTHNGNLLVEPGAVATKSGDPFKVFTPFWKAARERLGDLPRPLKVPRLQGVAVDPGEPLAALGLLPTRPDWSGGLREAWTPGEAGAHARLETFLDGALDRYAAERDVPAADATSSLSPHLRFGEISPRTLWHVVHAHAAVNRTSDTAVAKFLSELGWREFSYHLLHQAPDLHWRNFQPRFDGFPWREGTSEAVRAWQRGRTGYPIVDAGMRQLWATGGMHNRVRMIVASFLVKHLLVHWRVGEAWFWDTLVDADPANNAASWQWVAGSGADAAPYFRIFNPVAQGERFDPDGAYVRRWVPEVAGLADDVVHRPWTVKRDLLRNRDPGLDRTYPEPIVDHQTARDRALAAFDHLKSTAA